jgi:hypothetical protein
MNTALQTEYVTRDNILKLLSDDEVAKVSSEETAARLSDGDEYVDLDEIDQGVQRAVGATTPTARMLPRRAVRQDTWIKILTQLAAGRVPPQPHASSLR